MSTSTWRDNILNELVPKVNKLTLVADPDRLLTEEKLAVQLRQRGFDLIEFSDPIAFRYAYESQYRALWDQGEQTDLIVILRVQKTELDSLPYDLLQAGRKLSFTIGNIFPNLSYPVIEELDRSLLDSLYAAQERFTPDRLGDNATKDFILRHVYGIDPELIFNEVKLLGNLLRMHYHNFKLPRLLIERLISVLSSKFSAWPLTEIISDAAAFFAFLQERWPLFVTNVCGHGQSQEKTDLKYPGPTLLPFDHPDIKVFIDDLFADGQLVPVVLENIDIQGCPWVACGISAIDGENVEAKILDLFDRVEKGVPAADVRHSDWVAFAQKWAELSALVHCQDNQTHKNRLNEIGNMKVNTAFTAWLTECFAGLITLPPSPLSGPALVHHIPRFLARVRKQTPNERIALIVIDGLSLDQWRTVRSVLLKKDPVLTIKDSAAFSWIPTLTSISRQAIFAGKPPLFFKKTITSTNSEEKLWKKFWEDDEDSKLTTSEITYARGLGDGDASADIESLNRQGESKVLGLVVDKVDKIMHGMELGAAGMHNQIQQWCNMGYLNALLNHLFMYGYDIWLTADHGNIECVGTGKPHNEGVLPEYRGERVRDYPMPELRSRMTQECTTAYEWKPIGLPEGHYPLLAKGNSAFMHVGETIVGHGAASIEEVIVPFVHIERKL